MIYYSPLRYPGGKGRLSSYFKKIYETNSLCTGTYVEPYAGGASVALSLMIDGYTSRVIVNDVNLSIYAFWYSVINETEELCRRIYDTPIDVSTWHLQHRIQKESDKHTLLELGFSTFFLNRTNRSGILNAGIIGGKNQSGKWKIDARFNKSDLINRIQRISLYKPKIELYNLDAVILLEQIKDQLPSNSLIYLDPPYYTKGKELYLNYYGPDDHIKVAKAIDTIDARKWVITYDHVNFIYDLYCNYRKIKYSLNYSASKATEGEELMIFSNNLNIPNSPPLGFAN